MRYEQLNQIIAQVRPRTIIEVGTWNGDRAIQMATEALKNGPVTYYGFDLFEGATPETDAEESNVKAHYDRSDVYNRLSEFQKSTVGFTYHLIGGNTRATLDDFELDPNVDAFRPVLAFIDGGHSLETIASDYGHLKWCDYVVMDDYYVPENGNPDIEKFGCNKLLEQIGNMGEDWFVLPAGDPVQGGGRVHMVAVGFNPKINVEKKLQVQTVNAVKDDVICDNVRYALSLNLPEAQVCERHWSKLAIVSGGPTFKKYVGDFRYRPENSYLSCVKTSHDWLIEHDVIPDFCVLLDPRPHVLDFVEDPHPDVTYFVASQVHKATFDRLLERNANVVLYHALVGAGEHNLLSGKKMITGGSTSATRGISLYTSLGFSRFDLYGFDTCFLEPPVDYPHKEGGKKLIEVTVRGAKKIPRKFITTPELIAQAQDFEKIAEVACGNNAITLNVYGDGIIPHVWNQMDHDKADFRKLYGHST